MSTSATVGTLKVLLQADTAAFNAAMKSATADVQKIGEALKKDLEPRQRAVNAAVRDFLGTDEIRRAQEYVQAIQRIGDVSTLTEANQKKVNKAVTEAIDQYKALGQAVPAELQKIQRETSGALSSTQSYNVSFGKLVSSFLTAQAIIGAVEGGFGLLAGAITKSITAAGDAEKAHAQLVAALRAQGTAIPSVIDAYSGYASALQKTTIYQDDAIEAATAMLVQVGNVMPREMKKALQATTDLASGMGIDLNTAVLAVAKAAEGNVTGLKKMGVSVDDAKVKQEGFGAVLDAITAKFGGQAAALAGTYQGRLEQLSNTWNNLEESVGRAITTNQTVLDLFGYVNQSIDANTKELNQNRAVTNLVSDAVILSVRAFSELAGVIDILQTGGSGFTITIRNMAGALGNIGVAALEASKAVAFMGGAPTAGIDAMIAELNSAVKELGDRNEATTERSVRFGMSLDAIRAKADALAAQLKETRGKTVELSGATDTSADAWDRHTTAVKNATESEKAFKAEMDRQEGVWKDQLDAQREYTAQSERDMEAFFAALKKDADDAANLAEAAWKDVLDGHKVFVDQSTKEMDQFFEGLDQIAKMQGQAADLQDRRTLSSANYQIAQIKRWAAEQKATYKGSEETAQDFYDAIDAVAKEKLDAIKTSWADSFSTIASSFQQMAQIGGDSFGGVAKAMGQSVASLSMLVAGTTQVSEAFKDIGTNWQSAAAGMASGYAAIFSSMQLLSSWFDKHNNAETIRHIIDDTKAATGEMVSGTIAAQILNTEVQKVQSAIVAMSASTGKSWAQIVNEMGATNTHQIAAWLNLNSIIQENGGITARTMDKWIGEASHLFDIVKAGGTLADLATQELETTIQGFTAQAEKSGGVWSAAFQGMIAQARELGIGLDSINSLIDGQLSKISAAASKVTGGLTGSLASPGKQLDDLKATQKDQAERGDLSGAEETARQIKDLTYKTVTELQPEFDRLNRITLASFNAYISQGHTAVEAIAAVGPAFDQLKAAADKFGFAGSEAFNQLSHWRDLTTANQPLLDQVSGLNELMSALANVGSLDASTFADLQAQGVATFQQLTAAGFTQQEALTQMAPMLQTIKDLHEQNGLAIDDATQALINQADAQGVLKDKEETTQDVLKAGLGAIIKAIGGDLPAAWEKASKAGKDAAKDIKGALNEIPDKTVKITYDTSGYPNDWPGPGPGDSQPNDGSNPGTPSGYPSNAPGYAVGGVIQPKAGGRLIRVAEAGYPETVLPGDWSKLLASARQMPNWDGAMAGVGLSTQGMSAPDAISPMALNISGGEVYLDGKKVGKSLWKPMVEDLQRRQLTR